MRAFATILVIAFCSSARLFAEEGSFSSELIFPLHAQHNHAPGIVECPNGDLLVSWYRGTGERSADDVAVYGARKAAGQSQWSEPFLMADTPGFPDCNTCMIVDRHDRLLLFYPTILANTWESCLTRFHIATDYESSGPPKWSRQSTILLKPNDFSEQATQLLDQQIRERAEPLDERSQQRLAALRRKLADRLFQRLGWQPRCKPTLLPSGRILLPLYTDTFSISIMAISDDDGETWYASEPLIGFGNIQPAVVRREDGTLVAYMRENGPRDRIRVAESKNDGMTWGPVGQLDLPNPGSGLDAQRLANGHWLLVYNDSTQGRRSLAVSLSEDEGKTWKFTRHLEQQSEGAYHYPAITQGRDGRVHVIYSYFVRDGKSMKHASFDESWVRRSD